MKRQEKLYSLQEAARELGVTAASVKKWLAQGRVEAPWYTGGGAKLFSRTQLDKMRRWRAATERRKARDASQP